MTHQKHLLKGRCFFVSVLRRYWLCGGYKMCFAADADCVGYLMFSSQKEQKNPLWGIDFGYAGVGMRAAIICISHCMIHAKNEEEIQT